MNFNWNFFATVLFVVLAIAVVAFLSWSWQRWEEQRRRKKMARAEVELGLEPVDKSDPELNERFAKLRRQRTQPPRIGVAWKREESNARFYVIVLWVDSANDNYELRGECVLVVSPRLNLPRFGLLPKYELTGFIYRLLGAAREYAVDRLGRVPIENHPEFASHYNVIGDDKIAIQQFLTESRLNELARLPYRGLEAGGDMFQYSRWKTYTGKKAESVELSELLDEARSLCRAFQTGD
jgi:hypothetical protein